VGLSFFLLVPICLGDRDIRVAGAGLPQIEDLEINKIKADWLAGVVLYAGPAALGEKMQRASSINRRVA
jgi:hypothetical protein